MMILILIIIIIVNESSLCVSFEMEKIRVEKIVFNLKCIIDFVVREIFWYESD